MKGRLSETSFTLIELLVVIAIIAILASMLLPALNKARERGKDISCKSNLKQQGVGVTLYSDSYNDWLPIMGLPNKENWKTEILTIVSQKPVDSTAKEYCSGIFKCPTAVAIPNVRYVAGDINNFRRGGYGWNYNWIGYYPGVSGRDRKKLVQVKKPGQTVFAGDAESPEAGVAIGERWQGLYYPGIADMQGLRHGHGINFLWGDGHSASLSTGECTLNYGRINGINYYYWEIDK